VLRDRVQAAIPDAILYRIGPSKLIRRWLSGGAASEGVLRVGVGKGLLFDPGSSNHAYASGDNELPVQECVAAHLAKGNVLYDVGANVGFLTVIGAHLVGAKGTVYAFEPVPDNVNTLRGNVARNGLRNVRIQRLAVADKSGQTELVLARYSGGAALASVEAPPDAAGRIQIQTVSIDDLVFERGFKPPSMVKIDVEGAEIDVLKGMPRTLRTHGPIVLYEIDGATIERVEEKHRECDQYLRSVGYTVTQLENSYTAIRWQVAHYLAMPPQRSRQ
jgi:FkbM family methyltransferase